MKDPTDSLVIGQLERSAGEMQAGRRVLLGQSAGSCAPAKRTAGGAGPPGTKKYLRMLQESLERGDAEL